MVLTRKRNYWMGFKMKLPANCSQVNSFLWITAKLLLFFYCFVVLCGHFMITIRESFLCYIFNPKIPWIIIWKHPLTNDHFHSGFICFRVTFSYRKHLPLSRFAFLVNCYEQSTRYNLASFISREHPFVLFIVPRSEATPHTLMYPGYVSKRIRSNFFVHRY